MGHIHVIFGRSHTLASAAIRLFTWSRWSHCGIIYRDMVIEATAKHGVTMTPLAQFKERYSEYSIAQLPVDDASAAISRALDQLGKPYDWSGVFGIVLRTDWDGSDKWFCSELIAHASQMFRKERVNRISPEYIWAISKNI